MRKIWRYRMRATTPAILLHEQAKDEMVTLPEGSIVIVDQRVSAPAPLMEVFWNGKKIRLFTADFREKAELMESLAT
jgi:hypothetical protein